MDTARAAKLTGATPAIQSQCTDRPNNGLIVALATRARPITAAAQESETPQLLGASAATDAFR